MSRSAVALALALMVIGCGGSLPQPFPLLTGDPYGRATVNGNLGCFTNHARGPLTVDPTSGTAIADSDDNPNSVTPVPVMWRPGFTARHDGSEVTVLDPAGNVVATTGRHYLIEGGYVDKNGRTVFWACDAVIPQ